MARGTRDWGVVTSGVQGIAQLPTYTAIYDAANFADTQRALLSLFNPAASGVIARVRYFAAIISWDLGTGFNTLQLAIERTSAQGSGGAVAEVKHDTGDPDAACVALTDHTVNPTSAGALGYFAAVGERDLTLQSTRATLPIVTSELFRELPGQASKPITLLQGEGTALRVVDTAALARVGAIITWTEEAI